MVKTCPQCGYRGSNFGVRARHPDGSVKWLASWCRDCTTKACREWRKSKGEDPAKRRARQRRWLSGLDPETAAIRRDQGREYHRRRHGVTPDRYRTSRYMRSVTTIEDLPTEPFAAWLRAVMERDGASIAATALRLGIADRTLRAILNDERESVELSTVERALIADDTDTLRDVYPDLYAEAA